MQLTLDQAAIKLGRSVRQVRYMVQKGKLRARKVGHRWMIEDVDLPSSPQQRDVNARKERQLRAAVERGLDLPTRRARYSVRNLKACQIALPLYHRAQDALGPAHPATLALRGVIEQLARGCHRYEHASKAAAYNEAREAASQAISELLLSSHDRADPLITDIEQELMAALAGLLRRLDRKSASASPRSQKRHAHYP